jgi:hypothetical protein
MSLKNRIQRASTGSVKVLPYVAGTLSVLLCLWCATESLGFGFSHLYAARAFENNDLSLANRAVLLARSDPEAYSVRAAVLAQQKRFTEATVDLEHALVLSPRDADLWIKLGDDRAQLQDTKGALRAYSEATRLAPGYAHSHWLIGNCLLKAGRLDEAFAELRLASTIMPSLYAEAVEIGWSTSSDNPHFLVNALPPQTPKEFVALSVFLFHQGKTEEARALLRGISPLSEEDRLSLLSDLLNSRRFVEARQVWLAGRPSGVDHGNPQQITDGSFEYELIVDDPGFGWQFQQSQRTISASLDTSYPRAGVRSLRLDWQGYSDPSTPVFGQLFLVKPKSHYRLTFAARSQNLVSGSLPFVTVVECNGNITQSASRGKVLARSEPIFPDVLSWRQYTIDFTTAEEAEAVYVVIRREHCSDAPCPIFGSTWFDDFNLKKSV